MSARPAPLADDGLGFEPLGQPQQRQRGTAPNSADQDLGFEPLATQPKPSNPPPAAQKPARAPNPNEPAIRPYHPSLWQRVKNVFTEGVPRYSSRTVYNPKFGREQIVTPEAILTPGEQRKHPMLTGALEATGGMTSPENAAILAGTGGLGELPGAAGEIVPRLLSAGFTAQAVKNAWQQNRAFQDALKRGDSETAKRILGQFLVNATVGTLAGKYAFEGEPAPELGTLDRAKAAEPELVVNGDLARDRLARRMSDVRANQAARQGIGELERRIEAGKQARINAPIALPKPAEEPPTLLNVTPRPEPTLAEQAAEAREQLADEGRLEPPGGFRVVDRRTLAPELREPVTMPAHSTEENDLGFRLISRRATRSAAEETPAAVASEARGGTPTAAGTEAAAVAGVPPVETIPPAPQPKITGMEAAAERLRREGRLPPAAIEPNPAPEAHALQREAQAYLENVDRIKGKLKRAKGAQATSDGAWLASTDNSLRRAFNAEKRPGELFGDFLQRIAGRPDLKPKSLPFRADYPNFSVTPRPESTEPLEKAQATPYQKQQAQLTVNRIRNLVRREYAQSYLRARLEGLPEPDRGELPGISARAIRSDIDYALSKQKARPVREQFPPDVIEQAETEMRNAENMLSSAFPEQPGRYRTGPASGLREDENKRDEWYGIGSSRPMVAQMFPWYEDETISTPAQLRRAVEKGKGADYERIVRHVAEGIMHERETAAPVIAEYEPQLRELADATRATDPDLSQTLTELADGKLTLAAPKLRAYIQGVIADAETKANVAATLDAAEAEAREQAGLAEAAGERHPVRENAGAYPVGQPEGVLPGMQGALEDERQAAAEQQGRQLTEQLNRPAETIEPAAGQLETRSPLFRGTAASPQREIFMDPEEAAGLSAADLDRLLRDESGAASPELIADLLSGRLGREAWQRFVASPLVRGLGLGDKYEAVKQADPELAEKLHLLDNAAPYFRQKAAQTVGSIVGNLSRQQERLFTLMADADSRENLRQNHPAEYQAALRDPAIQEALRRYRPIERELTAARERMGGATLPGDYLRRVYEEHVAGIGKEQAPGQTAAAVPFERVVPQRVPGLSREASAEYHYENGLHEFGPAFGTKFVGTNLAALRDSVARDFMSKATELPKGSLMPRSIEYNGKTYFRPDIAAEMGRDTPSYRVYDPTEGVKFPAKTETGKRFLGPASIVDTLRDYGLARRTSPSALNRFLQEQVIGFGLGLPHVANILRRVMQAEPGAQLNPRAWADAWRVLFDRELRARGVKGLDDPAFDRLAKHGAITPGDMRELKKYWGGNLNPANWARSMAQIGHRLLFEPGTFRGMGGIDQRARIWVADLVKSQHPELSDAEIADAVSTELGSYNRRNWTETQKRVAPFMLFPGWSLSSLRWVLEHPVKTTVPPALLVLAANQALQRLGVQKQPEDAWDIQNLHIGNRSIGVNLLRESMARNLARPLLNYAQSRILGENPSHALRSGVSGLESGAGGLAGTLNPILTGAIALATNRQDVFNRRELIRPQDWNEPGVVLPNKALDSLAALAVRHAVPSLDRVLQPDEPLDFAEFAGGNLGFPNYRYGAEQRLKRNAARAAEAYGQIRKLARSNRQAARQYVRDPENAAYLIFHSELEHMASTLKRIDAAREAIENAPGLTTREKRERLANIENAQRNLLKSADGLDRLIFQRIHGGTKKPKRAAGAALAVP